MKIIVNNKECILTTNKLEYIDVLTLCGVDTKNAANKKFPVITTVAKVHSRILSEIVRKNEPVVLIDGMIISSLG